VEEWDSFEHKDSQSAEEAAAAEQMQWPENSSQILKNQ
jgi:hypothetical protein